MGLIKELGAWGASSAVGETIIVATGGSIATAGAATILGAATLTAAAGALYGALWKTAYEYSKENPIWEGARDMKLFDHNDVDLRDLYKGSFQYIDAVPDKVSLKDPANPLQHGLAALGLKSDDVDITRTEAGEDGSTSESRDIRDKDTSEVIGSYAGTPTGCEMTAGNRKVVMSRITDSDVSLETYARNDEGDFELLGQSRISDNDGITVRRPFMGC